MAKSISVVVPPKAAARVPVSKSSELVVPPKGMSRWVCTSIPPGKTYFPAASMTFAALSRGRLCPIATILPLLMATSLAYVSIAVTTRPLAIIVSKPMHASPLPIAEQAFYAKLRHLGALISGPQARRQHAVRYDHKARHAGGPHNGTHPSG